MDFRDPCTVILKNLARRSFQGYINWDILNPSTASDLAFPDPHSDLKTKFPRIVGVSRKLMKELILAFVGDVVFLILPGV